MASKEELIKQLISKSDQKSRGFIIYLSEE